MAQRIRLREICHARSGNKGNGVNVGIATYDPAHYAWVGEQVTEQTVAEYVKPVTSDPISRYELPKLGAFNFVIPGVLEGSHSGTQILDTLGKCYSSILLDMEIDAPPDWTPGGAGRTDAAPSDTTTSPAGDGNGAVRLGCGSAHGWDNIEAGVELAESGAVDYLVFDNMSEGIGSFKREQAAGGRAYYQLNELRMPKVIAACAATDTKIITNMGIVDPYGIAQWTKQLCRDLGLPHLRVMAVLGDDVLDLARARDLRVAESGQPVSAFGDRLLSANAYISAMPIVEALQRGADIVVSGRAGDATQYLAPLIHEFGWSCDDWERKGKGLGIGHLMECGAQITGGYFPDPPYKDAPDLGRVGFPIALVDDSGDAVITKLPGTGGVVNRMTCLEQLLYEIGDPANYKHTDAVVDFSSTEITDIGPDRVRISGIEGHERPPTSLVVMNVHEGYFGVGEISYGGGGACARAELAAEIVTERLKVMGIDTSRLRFDYEGINSIFPWQRRNGPPAEVRLRAMGIFPQLSDAEMLRTLVHELSCNGPSGGGGLALFIGNGGTGERISLYTSVLPQEDLHYQVVEV
ncbi:MAG: DUF1446 domain-containing protein [Caldilineaceae bacterium]|nr:DUF1446 domain-containing protein [Caldilineaceae bacterium]MCY4117900.1 DUF1446 domain-containing protein [Caldilineaceae bacterium]